MKRCFDFIVSLTLIIVLSPLAILFAILIKFKLGSPILFMQERPGLHGRAFKLIKFRTMTVQVDEKGKLLSDHKRLTKFGSFLRKYSIDEIPQLVNVLKGELSLVGPRPLLMEYLPLYSAYQFTRHDVRPGITGWAQVNGRNNLSWEEKFDLDVWYVENRTFLLDMKILCLTVFKVLKSEGINQPGKATTERFTGTEKSKVSGGNG